jgi:hypothetical protein
MHEILESMAKTNCCLSLPQISGQVSATAVIRIYILIIMYSKRRPMHLACNKFSLSWFWSFGP